MGFSRFAVFPEPDRKAPRWTPGRISSSFQAPGCGWPREDEAPPARPHWLYIQGFRKIPERDSGLPDCRFHPAEPFELCARDHQQYALPISKTLLVPTVPVNSVIGWRTHIGESDSVDSRLAELSGFQGYYIAVIVVSEFSPTTFDYARVGNTTEPLRVVPGQSYEGWVKLNNRAETNALILLAQRHTQFDSNWLREQLQKRFPRSTESPAGSWRQDVDAATDFIKTLAPGSLIFPFVSVQEDSKCIY